MSRAAVRDADRDHEKAARKLVSAMLAEFPVGTEVVVTKGYGSWVGFVVGHGSWWSDPDRLQVKHHRTGKAHSAHYTEVRR